MARNIPQAYASLTSGKWERSKFSGVELYEKTLGILGFGRIGQLVAVRARAFGMRVLAFDPFVSAERYRELGVEKAENSEVLYAQADFITVHLPKTPETHNWLNAEDFAKMRDGVRILNVARGGLGRRRACTEWWLGRGGGGRGAGTRGDGRDDRRRRAQYRRAGDRRLRAIRQRLVGRSRLIVVHLSDSFAAYTSGVSRQLDAPRSVSGLSSPNAL